MNIIKHYSLSLRSIRGLCRYMAITSVEQLTSDSAVGRQSERKYKGAEVRRC